jgi:hypothetical protein
MDRGLTGEASQPLARFSSLIAPVDRRGPELGRRFSPAALAIGATVARDGRSCVATAIRVIRCRRTGRPGRASEPVSGIRRPSWSRSPTPEPPGLSLRAADLRASARWRAPIRRNPK